MANKILEKGADELPEQMPLHFTHEELQPTEIFSTLAALTPFSNHNQSPRNMYQCLCGQLLEVSGLGVRC